MVLEKLMEAALSADHVTESEFLAGSDFDGMSYGLNDMSIGQIDEESSLF